VPSIVLFHQRTHRSCCTVGRLALHDPIARSGQQRSLLQKELIMDPVCQSNGPGGTRAIPFDLCHFWWSVAHSRPW